MSVRVATACHAMRFTVISAYLYLYIQCTVWTSVNREKPGKPNFIISEDTLRIFLRPNGSALNEYSIKILGLCTPVYM